MRCLITHAGRHGDALWAMPTVRAIAETLGEPVDFCISRAYGGLAPLIQQQDYIDKAFADPGWEIRETAPITPSEPGGDYRDYDKVIHLSFKGWPQSETMAEGYWLGAAEQVAGLRALDLQRPWVRVKEKSANAVDVAVGFSDEHFELKLGVLELIFKAFDAEPVHFSALCAQGSRWQTEGRWVGRTWVEAAAVIQEAKVFFGCLSAPWVLANAVGKRAVIMEPSEARWNRVFWRDSHLNRMVMGGDGRPTWDSRACVQQLRAALEEVEG